MPMYDFRSFELLRLLNLLDFFYSGLVGIVRDWETWPRRVPVVDDVEKLQRITAQEKLGGRDTRGLGKKVSRATLRGFGIGGW